VRSLQEELESRLVDSEMDVHQIAEQYAQEKRGYLDRLSQLELTLKERDKLLLEYTGKNKELKASLNSEQESH